jgi:hypothetical protein
MTNLAEKLNFRSKKSVVKKTKESNSLISPIALAALGLFGAIEVQAAQSIDPVTDRAELLSAARAAFEAGGLAPERIEALMQLLASAPLDQLEGLVTKSLAAVAASFEQIPVETAVSADDLIQTVMQQVAVSLEAGELDLSPLPAMVSKVDRFDNTEPQQMLERIEGLSDAIAGAFNTGRAEGQGADAFMQILAAADTGTKSDSAPSTGAEAAAAATAAASSTSIGLLLALVAVAGGGGGSAAAAAASSSGAVVKGPLSGAFVFRDANGNYQFDAGEESTTTNASGAYTLAGSGGSIIATNPEGGSATDTFSNASFSGVLAAPSNASVVTPLTTLLAADPTLTVAKLQAVLGLDGVDLLTFNPFGAGVSDADKLKVEKVAVQVQEVLVSMGGAVADSGVNLGAAVKSVAKSLGETLGAADAGADAAATLSTALDGVITKVVAANPTVNTTVLNSAKAGIATAITSVQNAADLDGLKTVAKSSADALAAKASAAGFVKENFTIAVNATEDVASGGTGSAAGPTASVVNASRAKLYDYFDGVGAAPSAAPKMTIDLSGYEFSGSGTMDLSASLSKEGMTESLTIAITDVAVTTEGGLALGANQTASVSIKLGDTELATFALANADQLLLSDGNEVKVDFDAFMQQISGSALDTADLSSTQLAALAKVALGGVLQEATTDSLIAALKAAVTLPENTNTVSEAVALLQGLIDLPQISGLTVKSLTDAISNDALREVVEANLTALGVVVSSDTLSGALGKIGDSQIANWSASEVLSSVLDIATANNIGASEINGLLDDAVTYLFDSASNAGVTRQQLVDAVLGSVNSDNLSDVVAILEGIDVTDILGTNPDLVALAAQFRLDQTIDLSAMVPVIAKLTLATNGTIDFKVNNFDGVTVNNSGAAVTGFSFSMPVGSNDTPQITSTLEGAGVGGLTLPSGTFTGDIAAYALAYGSINSADKFVAAAELPEWVTFDAATGAISGTPLNGDVGTHYFVLSAYTATGEVTKKPFTLTVAESNDAPTAVDIPAQTIGEGLTGAAIDLSQYFSDIDTTESYNTLSYTVVSTGAATGTITQDTAELTIAASIIDGTDAGAGTVTVTASDGKGGSVSKDISVSVTQDTTAPTAPNASFVDNGSSESDGITSLGAVTVSGLEAGATIEISTNDGTSWTAQSLVDGKFTLPTGVYADDVSIRAVDAAGNEGAVTTLGIAEVVTAPATPTLTLGAAKEGAVAVGNLADVYTGLAGWQYSTDGGSTWSATQQSVGNDAKFTVQDASYAVGAIQVRSVNTAGFTSEVAESGAEWVVDTVAPTIASVSAGVLSGDVVTYDVSFTEAVVGVGVDDFTVGTNVTKTSVQLKSNTTATYEVALTVGAREASDIALNIAADAAITDAAGNAFVPGDVPDTISVADYLVGKTGSTLTSLNSGAGAETFIFGSTTDTLVIDAATDSTASATDTINGFTSGTDKIDISALLSDYSGLSTKTYTSDSKLSFTFETIALNEEGAVTTDPSAAVSHALRAKVYAKDGLFTGEDGTSTEGLIAFTIADVTGVGEMSVALSSAVFKGTPVTLVDGTLVSMGSEFVKAVAAGGYLGAVTITPSAGDSEAAVQSFADSFEMMLDTLSITLGSDTSTETDLPLPVSVSHPNGRTVSAVDELYTLGAAGDNSISISSVGGQTTVVYDDNPAAGTTTPTTLVFQTYATDGESVVNLSSTDFIFSS